MPCPPSFEELQMMRNEASLNESLPKFELWSKEIQNTFALFQEWREYQNSPEVPEKMARPMQTASDFCSDHVPKWLEASPNDPDHFSEKMLNYYSRMADWYEVQCRELEFSLCVLRTWLCEQASKATFIPPLFHKRLEKEKKLHLGHRLKDKEAALKNLEYTLAINQGMQKKETDSKKMEVLKAGEEKIRKDINFVHAIPDEVILVDRDILSPYYVNYYPVC